MSDDIIARAEAFIAGGSSPDPAALWLVIDLVAALREARAEVERLRGCPHGSWSGDGTGRWRCDECGADQGSQDVGEIRRKLVDAVAERDEARAAIARVEAYVEYLEGEA